MIMTQRTQSLDYFLHDDVSESIRTPELAYGPFSMTDPGQDLSGTLGRRRRGRTSHCLHQWYELLPVLRRQRERDGAGEV